MENKMLRCGNINCSEKDNCPHSKEHKWIGGCNDKCIHSKGEHKCYNLVEMRKIKLLKLETNEF